MQQEMIEIKFDKVKILDNLNPMQVLVLGFATVIAIGTVLLVLPISTHSGHSMGLVNALFESTSAVCVTGLTVLNTAKDLSLFGQIVIIFLIQIGGLGFMTMATLIFLLMGKRITLKERLIMQQALNQFSTQGVVKLTKYIIVFTLMTELIGALCLATVFIPDYGLLKGVYYSVFHAISAFCNAGFDLLGDSFVQYTTHGFLNIVIMLLITIGGIGFTVIIDLKNNINFKSWSLHTKIVMISSLILSLFGAIIFFFMEYQHTLSDYSFGNKVLASLFQSVTTRTAGFNTLPLDQLTDASKFIFVILMFIGASPASTGGGVKTVTAVVLVLMVITAARGKKEVNVFGKRISQETTMRALSVVAIDVGLLIIFTIFLSACEPIHFIDLFFETASALGTVGLATFDTALLGISSKLIIIISMFIGRVGPLTLVLALARKQSLKKPPVRYPEGKVMVG